MRKRRSARRLKVVLPCYPCGEEKGGPFKELLDSGEKIPKVNYGTATKT